MSALAKYVFHNPRVRDLLERRIDALRAVRQAKDNPVPAGSGAHADVWDAGDLVVKTPATGNPFRSHQELTKNFKRRGFLESILADAGVAPETMLVETRGRKYLVQPKADITPPGVKGEPINKDAARATGMTGRDLAYNWGMFKGEPKIFDAGEEYLFRATRPDERKSALEKFVSYGRRDKPWLK